MNNINIIKDGASSFTFKAPYIFVKYIVNFKEYDVYKREKYLASILKQFDWFPTLFYCDDTNQYFIYENVGVPITKQNKPKDLEVQFNKILKDLKSVNIQHNDIKLAELLVDKKGKLYLCDFGWGSINNNIGCGINIWSSHNTKKPGGYRDDASTLERLRLI